MEHPFGQILSFIPVIISHKEGIALCVAFSHARNKSQGFPYSERCNKFCLFGSVVAEITKLTIIQKIQQID